MNNSTHWEREARNWLRWARTPGFDSYWYYRDAFFGQIVPPARGLTLDLGCGEGRVARDLVQRGHTVTGLDSSPTLIREASRADLHSNYVLGNACFLPFPDRTFHLVVAYNSLMDIDDMPQAIREAARVLQPDGRLAICVPHPLNNAGKFTETTTDAPFVISDSYLGPPRHVDELFRRDGLEMRFRGWSYPLETYCQCLETAGLAIERLREPPASEEALQRFGHERWRRIPMFLMLRAFKPKPLV